TKKTTDINKFLDALRNEKNIESTFGFLKLAAIFSINKMIGIFLEKNIADIWKELENNNTIEFFHKFIDYGAILEANEVVYRFQRELQQYSNQVIMKERKNNSIFIDDAEENELKDGISIEKMLSIDIIMHVILNKTHDEMTKITAKIYNERKKCTPNNMSLDELIDYINNYKPTKLEKEVIKQTNNNILEAELIHQEIATTRPEIINNSANLDENKINEMVAEAIKEEYIRNENSQNNKTQGDAIDNKPKNKKQQSKAQQNKERANIVSTLLREEGFEFDNKGMKKKIIVYIEEKSLNQIDHETLKKLKTTLEKGDIVPQKSLGQDGMKIDVNFIRIKIGGINFVGPYEINNGGIKVVLSECIDNAKKSHNNYEKFKEETISKYYNKFDEYYKSKKEKTNDDLLAEIESLSINNNKPNNNTKNTKNNGRKKGR
ncbi:MAG: hypothetical protein RL208_628, partial [Pseudomonadota bacterium]